jgi:hypothetical protein
MIALTMTLISFVTEGYVLYPLAYLALMPDYICVQNGTAIHCSNEISCTPEFNKFSDGATDGYFINWNNQTSLDNWV